ncbi:DsrE/DsrF/TusD sulfur relay family protein [Alishewanella longhuensis]|uniref:DsrE/DsrF/TusD sulfur relay family protein n=1 Tax=Alishewanella longhuensis TaxID=1091037 RepID=UPI001E38C359|nr:DsrE family protein [Alishewanella longhuensis]
MFINKQHPTPVTHFFTGGPLTRFSLLLTQSPLANQSFASALQFAKAALAQGFTIEQIFLYEEAVLAAATAIDLPTDEPNLAATLAQFCQQQQIALLYCITAAEKRGVQADTSGHYIAAGLAEFAMRLANTKLVQF